MVQILIEYTLKFVGQINFDLYLSILGMCVYHYRVVTVLWEATNFL
jgi:hypothetical protein